MTISSNRDFERAEIDYEDAMATRYNRDYHEPPILRRHTADFVGYVATAVQPGDRVLDLGCGPASLWDGWLHQLPALSTLIGVDISPKMIEQARVRVPDGDFRVGSALALPLEARSVDVVIASSVLHHLPDASLPDALKEIQRVLAEHGKVVGREPVAVGRLADQPGWMSGAIMAFHHLVYRLTGTREYPEPEHSPHHHAYDPKEFLDIFKTVFAPKGIQFRHPFSYYVGRADHPLVERVAMWFDEWLGHRRGQEFYYLAVNNYCDAADVADFIRRELEANQAYDSDRFMALLQEAATLLERELKT